MAEVLNVEQRQQQGTHFNRKLRRGGRLPANLYGHGQPSVSLTLLEPEMARVLRHGAKLVELKGGVNESAIISDLQWDPMGHEVLHVDFMRVNADEVVTVEVPIETRGEAPGTKENGIVELLLHSVEVETTARSIPEKLHININDLQLGQTLTVADIEDLPTGAKVLADAETPVVHCVEPVAQLEEEAGAGEAEPEVIGKGGEEEEGEEG